MAPKRSNGVSTSADVHPHNSTSATPQRSKRVVAAASSEHKSNNHPHQKVHFGIPLFTAILTYFSYGMLIVFGHMRDYFGKLFGVKSAYNPPKGYAPIVSDFEDFFSRRLFYRIKDCWDRPICSAPSSLITIMDRKWVNKKLQLTGSTRECLNLGSYNYLGFGDPNSPCKEAVLSSLHQYGVSTCSTRNALGTTELHDELEKLVARYVGKEDALVFGMGFGTNSTSIPSLVGKGGLILSDSTNHASIAIGCRSSGAVIRVFKHNDSKHLEYVIRQSIIEGQPRTHRPWTKILIMVEGIYSMEGEMCPLKEIVAIKKKYNCYLYVDEAHSIGAIGKTGRGICEHSGVPPSDVDILMGTFTKSFGAVGGYIASTREIINFVRYSCAGSLYSASISPPACQQVISAIKIILGEDGTDIGARKLAQLRDNANYFRRRLLEMGCHVLGDFDSPVVPLMLYPPGKITAFSRECYQRGLAVVVVGFPAAPLLLARTRFCLSAGHTREQLEVALEKVEEVVDLLGLRYARKWWK